MMSFNETQAKCYGLKEAIVLHKITFYVLLNKKNGTNYHLGKYWTFQSREGWRQTFGIFSDMQIWRSLKSLENQGALESSSFNKRAYDKTRWYTLSNSLMREALGSPYWKKVHYKNAKSSFKNEITNNKTATPIQVEEKLGEEINQQPY